MTLIDGTYDAHTANRRSDTDGYYVSLWGYETVSRSDAGTRRVFESARSLGPGHYVGVWTDDDGVTYTDVSVWEADADTAADTAAANAQRAYWDIRNGVAVPVCEPVSVDYDGVRTWKRVDGKRGHTVTCERHGIVSQRVTREPAARDARKHLADSHPDVGRFDVWWHYDGVHHYVYATTGHRLSVFEDGAGDWVWHRYTYDGRQRVILAHGTASSVTAARTLAELSDR